MWSICRHWSADESADIKVNSDGTPAFGSSVLLSAAFLNIAAVLRTIKKHAWWRHKYVDVDVTAGINCFTSLAGVQLGMPSVNTKVLDVSRMSRSIPCSEAKSTCPHAARAGGRCTLPRAARTVGACAPGPLAGAPSLRSTTFPALQACPRPPRSSRALVLLRPRTVMRLR